MITRRLLTEVLAKQVAEAPDRQSFFLLIDDENKFSIWRTSTDLDQIMDNLEGYEHVPTDSKVPTFRRVGSAA